jgi:hypothetical protein
LKNSKDKASIAIALILMFAMAVSLFALPTANAHYPPWEISSFAYIAAQPDPVGVGQRVMIYMWVDTPMPNAAVTNDIRRHGYKLTITKPNEETETKEWPILSDSTGIQYVSYTPDQVGTYTLKFDYAGQIYTWDSTSSERTWTNDTFLPASATTTFTVQEEPLSEPVFSYPLPTEYWTRPIEGQNTDWWSISSNWLGEPSIRTGATSTGGAGYGRFQPEGIAPNSPHVMWTKPIQDGGVVGGSNFHVEGTTYYMGGSYNVRFSNALVMYGRLYYELPWGNSGGGGGWMCVDLRTGEEIWGPLDFGSTIIQFGPFTFERPIGPSFGYLYDYDMYNQHGVIPNGWLFSSDFGTAIDPRTGRVAELNITNVPSGTAVIGPSGEHLRYVWNSAGKWLAQWNSSKVFDDESSGELDASTANSYDWNMTIPTVGPGSWSIYRDVIFDNILLLTQGGFGSGPRADGEGANVTAISLKPASIGQVLWTKHYPEPSNDETRGITAIDAEAGTFVTEDKETMRLTGFSLTDGTQVWSIVPDDALWDTMRSVSLAAYGNLYRSGFDGILYCYDMKDGNLLWTYGNGGEGNSTYAGLETAWGHYPIFVDVIADGKVYIGTTEHSPGSPFYKDARYRCVNATTGEEIWTMMGWGTGMYVGRYDIVADGFFVYLNCYDMQIYCVGKGPSATTVTASPKVSVHSDSVLVEGSVIDTAAGTTQDEQAARFPNGVPAVSDESMTDWMEYVYQQKPRPADATGVEVVIEVLDPNNNSYEVGRATTDASGMFSCVFTPEVPGKYTIIASFEGSEGYWPSHAETAINVEEAPAATPAPTPTPAPMTDTYVLGIGSAILIAVIIGFVLLLLRKR